MTYRYQISHIDVQQYALSGDKSYIAVYLTVQVLCCVKFEGVFFKYYFLKFRSMNLLSRLDFGQSRCFWEVDNIVNYISSHIMATDSDFMQNQRERRLAYEVVFHN